MNNTSLYPPSSIEGTDDLLEDLWRRATDEIRAIDPGTENWKIQNLPLARVKKIMKAEEFVMQELEKDELRRQGQIPDGEEVKSSVKFMIAADAPILLSRACELLIRELTCRAWQHTERNRRRTLQRQDLHAAVGESEVYDFLIDIVPRVATGPRGQASGITDPYAQAAATAAVAHEQPQPHYQQPPQQPPAPTFEDQQSMFMKAAAAVAQQQQQQQSDEATATLPGDDQADLLHGDF
mmetsp:Transcript_19386/g.40082  ORF Transcript_19386/g.40082 Transcript_19386/m.40082 type:complete len:238 (-) Transcript_19386:2434-3147(-)